MKDTVYNYSYNLLFNAEERYHILIWDEKDCGELKAHKYQCVPL